MKARLYSFCLILLAISISACGVSEPGITPTPTPMETTAPVLEASKAPQNNFLPAVFRDSTGDRVFASGKLVVGTSVDYQPFEYYDADYQIVGFDITLMRELASRLGLQVVFVDIPFEGLPAALQTGQIDAAIAAISVTPERMAYMDFTNVYYNGQDSVLARQDSGILPIVSPAQLAQYRVGVQRGSVYVSWLENTLIQPGLMPESNMLRYAKAGDAVRDLREKRNDLVVLDKAAADEFILSGGVVGVGVNLNPQSYAIALPKGGARLKQYLNDELALMQKDGTIARLAQTFLEIKLPVVTPAPLPTATAFPIPTATQVPCYDGMTFQLDMTIADGTEIKQGQVFNKIWRIRNSGTCAWNNNYRLEFVQGSRLNGIAAFVNGNLPSGALYDMMVNMQAPNAPGIYTGIWQMVNDKGIPFGERVRVRIRVPGNIPPTPLPPTATAVPPVQPTLAPGPVIDYLNVSASTIPQNDILVVSWSFPSPGIVSARLTRNNPDGSLSQLYSGMDVPPQGQYEDLLVIPGTYSYTLAVSKEFGSTTVRTVVVNVTPVTPGAALRNGEWKLTRFINPVEPDIELSPIRKAELLVVFNPDGTVTGSTGCNPFRAQYTVPGGNFIQITGVLVTGKKLCDDAIMGQEALYMDLLSSVEQFEIIGKELVLTARNPDPGRAQMLNILRFRMK